MSGESVPGVALDRFRLVGAKKVLPIHLMSPWGHFADLLGVDMMFCKSLDDQSLLESNWKYGDHRRPGGKSVKESKVVTALQKLS